MAAPYDSTPVKEYLFKTCSRSLLSDLARESEYWANSEEFVMENEDRAMGALSPGQQKWAAKIKDGLLSEAKK